MEFAILSDLRRHIWCALFCPKTQNNQNKRLDYRLLYIIFHRVHLHQSLSSKTDCCSCGGGIERFDVTTSEISIGCFRSQFSQMFLLLTLVKKKITENHFPFGILFKKESYKHCPSFQEPFCTLLSSLWLSPSS